ncbi:MAG: hypothetical protein EXR52_08460 [Dehalococcoidia bacterium]|nr:hypothetical protein [Dehalococcoidia bacterium]
MKRARLLGAALCLFATLGTVLFLWGLATQAYWALAIPVGLLVVATMSVVLWIGWAFIMTEAGPEQLPVRPQRPPTRPRT